jgi:hypothetical protein
MADQAADTNENDVHELRDLFVREVSLVGKAANRRTFLLYKSAKGGNMPQPLTEVEQLAIETALNTPTATEETVLKAMELAKALDAGDKNKVIAALRLLGGVQDEAVKALVKELSGAVGEKADEKPAPTTKTETPAPETTPARKEQTVPTPDEKPAVPEKIVDPPAEIVALAKAGNYAEIMKAAGANPGVIAVMVELLKSRDGEITDLKKFMAEQIAKSDDAEVARIVDEADLPGASRDDQIALVKAMDSPSRAKFAALATGIKANLQAGLYEREIGTSRRSDGRVLKALDTVKERAKEIVTKSGDKLSEGDALLRVLEDDPALAAQYRAEVRGEA